MMGKLYGMMSKVVLVVFMLIVLMVCVVMVKEFIVGDIMGWDFVLNLFFYNDWVNGFKFVFGDKIGKLIC